VPSKDQTRVKERLGEHTKYLRTLHDASTERMKSILSEKSTDLGPGMYLSRWQDLIDATLLTPLTAEGPVRTGKNASPTARVGAGLGGSKKKKKQAGSGTQRRMRVTEAPDVSLVVELMGDGFAELLRSINRDQ